MKILTLFFTILEMFIILIILFIIYYSSITITIIIIDNCLQLDTINDEGEDDTEFDYIKFDYIDTHV
jgi:competence protein ComGC